MMKYIKSSRGLRGLAAGLFWLMAVWPVVAQEIKIGDLYYRLNATTDKTAMVLCSTPAGRYSGDIVIPDTVHYNNKAIAVTSLGWKSFYGCSGLTSIGIPSLIPEIARDAFDGCSGLTAINVDERNARYCSEDGILYNKDKTRLVRCPEGKAAVNIPSSVAEIGYEAFKGCSGLTSIEIPTSVTEIRWKSLYGCSGLTSIEIPSSVMEIERSAFDGCSGLMAINVDERNVHYCSVDGVLYNKDKTRLVRCPEGKAAVNIPSSVTEIEKGAFRNCSNLTFINIPYSVTSVNEDDFIGWGLWMTIFSGCRGLIAINVDERNAHYCSVDGVLYNKDKTRLVRCPEGKTAVNIPSSVAEIHNYAFFDCRGLTITLDESNENNGRVDGVFVDGVLYNNKNKTRLVRCSREKTQVDIPSSVTEIGDYAFKGCSGLISITIPSSVLSIGFNVFQGCIGLRKVTMLDYDGDFDGGRGFSSRVEEEEDPLSNYITMAFLSGSIRTLYLPNVLPKVISRFRRQYKLGLF